MEVIIPPKNKICEDTPLPERVGTIIVDCKRSNAYLLCVDPRDMNTPMLMSLSGASYRDLKGKYSEPCTMIAYGDIWDCLGTEDILMFTAEEYMLDLVRKDS